MPMLMMYRYSVCNDNRNVRPGAPWVPHGALRACPPSVPEGRTDRRTDGRTDGRTDRQTKLDKYMYNINKVISRTS